MPTPSEQGPLNNLLPEIYPIIAAQLPLYATPSTLLSLALTNRHISETALPLVYSRLILKNEADALLVLQKLEDDPLFGKVVRELHVMSDLSLETRIQSPPSDVVRRVADVISKGYLPFIHTLGLHLSNGWYYDDRNNYEPVKGFGQLGQEFWSQIKKKCPRLRALILDGFTDDLDEPWLEDSGLLQVLGITSFSIYVAGGTLQPSATMAFWERHPSIEYLNIASSRIRGGDCWFTSAPADLLPKLRHLRVHWNDALLLAPILGRVLSLSIHESINAQIPYLLRTLCSKGLPNLRSLDIGQAPSSSNKNKSIEGSLWYEDKKGVFQRATNKASRTVFDNFMHSIVRAAPNLEEIGFHGASFPLPNFVSIAGDLNGFIHLKHIYYEEHYFGDSGIIPLFNQRDIFASQARDLFEHVPGIISITNVATLHRPYMAARITRGEDGQVVTMEVGNGYGMKIGYDDEPFPGVPYDAT
ncbi:hypothetical protein BDZ94DRAFT_1302414 [Collybia nuda]|uniref:F-box domain-containing protein n=1 Tax=Collybia nuda TaxID=64659 RepID=A0A9P5XS89_9AGAR|nr:hypothetical protein BDZ94DRAFT_1302414 [Collybia nuda]